MKNGVNENDPRVKRTRDLLLQALYELAEEKDMRTITVQDIAERATLNRATFYAHFRDKEALMDAAFRSKIRVALEAKLSPTSHLTKGNLRLLFHVLCDVSDTTVRKCPRQVGESHPLIRPAVREELYAFILEWLKQTLPNERSRGFPPETLATVLSWSLFGATIEWSRRPTKRSRESVAEEVVDLLSEGLGSAVPSLRQTIGADSGAPQRRSEQQVVR